MKLSNKKKMELWRAVDDKVMDARVKISILMKEQNLTITLSKIDLIMSNLCQDAPSSALRCFEK